MISARAPRRRGSFAWSAAASALIHLALALLISLAVSHVRIVQGERERVTQTTFARIETRPRPTPQARRPVVPRVQREVARAVAPAAAPRRELAREVAASSSPQPPQRHAPTMNFASDEAGFAREVARLRAADDPHAVPTIDPSRRGASMKSYSFSPSSVHGEQSGNGLITPVRSWRQGGDDCYHGRYEFTYPDGASETGDIAWPFCYDAALDPFKQAPHLIPFPLPLPGFRLPAGTTLPPIEKSVYQEWAARNGLPGP